jgi:DNA-binding LytR/AlgR family response regulator
MSERTPPPNEPLDHDEDEVIPVEVSGHIIPVARSRVRWIDTHGDYVQLHTLRGSYLVRETLEDLTQRWSPHGFMRIHRQYLVFFPLVTDVWREACRYKVRLGYGPNAVELPVSRRNENEVKQRWIQEHRHTIMNRGGRGNGHSVCVPGPRQSQVRPSRVSGWLKL